jgi:hypothetical protein
VPYDAGRLDAAVWQPLVGEHRARRIRRWKRGDWLARPGPARGLRPLARRPLQGPRHPAGEAHAAEYRAGGWGVIGHVDHTVGYSDGTHWDPGKEFPYDVVLARANQIAIRRRGRHAQRQGSCGRLAERADHPARQEQGAVRTLIGAIRQSQKSQQADLDDIQTRLGAIEAKLNAPADPPAA